eukprot:CAMPEP_0176366956 /NCGR_PEP_ID=MMETSP0126-20121128/21537_1 /TAXON_ID=141414 ORGANISM="Strombidinopsis acuminatum, Strain SPMC142" /NCGR_SAMPLE_ID=MMETSP0126 /ASSEMBLY_ACC=CAM_ASM_000229 /LENGTH=120 /DNA_ID=CAMNT_0017724573 /DNA_START=296 /DNA_END=655 /DNA_ORIENTATION=+
MKTGNFACLTNFRTARNRTLKKDYQSRGFLVMEFAKIDDPDIPKEKRMPYENYLLRLYSGTYKGFNLLFGNVLEDPKSGGFDLKLYQDMNLPFKTKFQSPGFLGTGKVHGLSNGNLNEWW